MIFNIILIFKYLRYKISFFKGVVRDRDIVCKVFFFFIDNLWLRNIFNYFRLDYSVIGFK